MTKKDILDKELKEHMKRTAIYADILAKLLKMDKKEVKQIKRGALLHDSKYSSISS